ncbi:hypothetical protein NIES3275_10090 [Microchaete diplosiphon NIES-3275]|nr:hypothetical protein NIES3275_10090 [Microchaete diplosiphon NIES-3275]
MVCTSQCNIRHFDKSEIQPLNIALAHCWVCGLNLLSLFELWAIKSERQKENNFYAIGLAKEHIEQWNSCGCYASLQQCY